MTTDLGHLIDMSRLRDCFLSVHALTQNACRKAHGAVEGKTSMLIDCNYIKMRLKIRLRPGSSYLHRCQKLDDSGWGLISYFPGRFQHNNFSLEAGPGQFLLLLVTNFLPNIHSSEVLVQELCSDY